MTLRFFIKIFASAVSVHFWQGCFCALAQKAQKSGRVFPRCRASPEGVSPVRANSTNFYFFVENSRNLRRAHLHIAPRCKPKKTYQTCGFEGILEISKRRDP